MPIINKNAEHVGLKHKDISIPVSLACHGACSVRTTSAVIICSSGCTVAAISFRCQKGI